MRRQRRDHAKPGAKPRSRTALLGRGLVFLSAGALIGLLFYGLTSQAADTTIDTSLDRGDAAPAPGFELEVLDAVVDGPYGLGQLDRALGDGRASLDELRGQPLVVNFWASWCNPCREEAPVLERGWRKWRSRGLAFVGLNMQDVTDDARAFVDEFSLTYPSVRDPGKSVSIDYGVTGIPETYFLDAGGRVVGHAIGVLSSDQLDRGAEAALSGEVAGVIAGGEFRAQP